MQITVKGGTGNPVWQSPDGRVSIYDIVDQDGNKWSTKSHKIGKGIGQSFDVEVEQKNGKTYLRLPVDPNSPYANNQPAPGQQPLAPSTPSAPGNSSELIEAIRELTQAIQLSNAYQSASSGAKQAVAREPMTISEPSSGPIPPDEDYMPSDDEIAEMETTTPEQIAELFGGEIVDDL